MGGRPFRYYRVDADLVLPSTRRAVEAEADRIAAGTVPLGPALDHAVASFRAKVNEGMCGVQRVAQRVVHKAWVLFACRSLKSTLLVVD